MEKIAFGKIGVLMGGPSTEREISLKSGHAVVDALTVAGLNVRAIDVTTDDVSRNTALFRSLGIDCAFIALHGRFGEDGAVQEILETLDIPYTGSGVKASRLAMDKIASREIFKEAGLAVPRCQVFLRSASFNVRDQALGLGLPLVVKPATHGSSIGLSIVDSEDELQRAVNEAFRFDERIVVEEYVQGRELTVGIVDEKPLPVVEIVPKKRFFDYEAKYKAGMTEYVAPAELDGETARHAQEAALIAHRSLGCYGCSRVDMLLAEGDKPVVLELNSIPGLTPTSLLPKAARVAGIDFVRLCVTLIRLAYERKKAGISP